MINVVVRGLKLVSGSMDELNRDVPKKGRFLSGTSTLTKLFCLQEITSIVTFVNITSYPRCTSELKKSVINLLLR